MSRFVIFEYGLIAVSVALLASEWIRKRQKRVSLLLIIATVSCVWLLLGLLWRSALGGDYSNLHAYIVLANLAASIIVAICALIFRSQRSARVFGAATSLAFVWFVTFSIMYAV
jgi:hypothetical protein